MLEPKSPKSANLFDIIYSTQLTNLLILIEIVSL